MGPAIDPNAKPLLAPEQISAASAKSVETLKIVQGVIGETDAATALAIRNIACETSVEALPGMGMTAREHIAQEKRAAVRRDTKRALAAKLDEARGEAQQQLSAIQATKSHYAPVSYLQAFGATPEGMTAFAMLDHLGEVGFAKEVTRQLGKLAGGDRSALPWLGAAIFALEKIKSDERPISIQKLAKAATSHLLEYQQTAAAIADAERALIGIINISRDVAKDGKISAATKLALGLMDRANAVHRTPREQLDKEAS